MEFLRHLQATWPPWALDLVKVGNGLLLLVLLFVPLERLFALRPKALLREGWRTDVVYYFITSLLPPRLVVLPVAALLWALHAWAPQGLLPGAAQWPVAVRLPLALAVAEVGFYWGHRWMHASAWLWRFHAVHHSAPEMDWLVNSRAHPLDLVLTRLCGLLPLYLLGLAQPGAAQIDWVPLLVTLIASVWGYVIHANLRWRFGVLEHVIATPAFHHWHHARLEGAARHHGNYAAMLPLMDRVFGTWRRPGNAWPARYGTAEPVPRALLDQLLAPFMGARR
jgi:sterol desaturase/sphingolipid hydroxylase (fatty acid hydroxylase superfamily)